MIEDRTCYFAPTPVSNKIVIVSNDKDGVDALWYTPHYRIREDVILKELGLSCYSNVDNKSIVIMCDMDVEHIIMNENANYFVNSLAEVLNDISKEMEIERTNIDFRNDTEYKWLKINLNYFVTTAFDQYNKKQDNFELQGLILVNVQYKNRVAMVPYRLLMQKVSIDTVDYWQNECHYFIDDKAIYKCMPDCFSIPGGIISGYDKDISQSAIIICYTNDNKDKAVKLADYLSNVYGLENPYA